jgi:hypothetical protein
VNKIVELISTASLCRFARNTLGRAGFHGKNRVSVCLPFRATNIISILTVLLAFLPGCTGTIPGRARNYATGVETRVLYEKPVRIFIEWNDDEFKPSHIIVEAPDGGTTWSFASRINDLYRPKEEMIPSLRKIIGWREGYLFVRTDPGGNAWRNYCDQVFVLHNGQLVHLGKVAVSFQEKEILGPSYRHGRFFDVFDGLEFNAYTCHASAPRFATVLQNQDGFTVLTNEVWQINQPTFRHHLRMLSRLAPDFRTHADINEGYDVRAPLLWNATLAWYCSRRAEFQRTIYIAQAIGCPIDWLKHCLASVRPGQLPLDDQEKWVTGTQLSTPYLALLDEWVASSPGQNGSASQPIDLSIPANAYPGNTQHTLDLLKDWIPAHDLSDHQ